VGKETVLTIPVVHSLDSERLHLLLTSLTTGISAAGLLRLHYRQVEKTWPNELAQISGFRGCCWYFWAICIILFISKNTGADATSVYQGGPKSFPYLL